MILIFFPEGLGATLNVAKPKKGQSVAIFGLGAVGLAVSFLLPSVQLFKALRSKKKIILSYPCVFCLVQFFRPLKGQECQGLQGSLVLI